MLQVRSIKIPLVALLLFALLLSATNTASAASTAQSIPDFGPNVIIFDSSMPVGEIQAIVDEIHASMNGQTSSSASCSKNIPTWKD